MTIVVYGMPAPQGSKRYVGTSKAGRGILIESSAKVKPWRQAVSYAAVEQTRPVAYDGILGHGFEPIRGAVSVHMIFTVPKPKSAPKRIRTWPDRKPDLSKLVRSTEDALTDAGVWEDDARVVRCVASKVYPGEGTDSLNTPGAVIRIEAVKE